MGNFKMIELLKSKGGIAFKAMCDIGCVKIGNENFNVNIPNLHGDGVCNVIVLENKNVDFENLDFLTSVEGTFNIYDYDCDTQNVIYTCKEGRYGIYRSSNLVVFKKWE